MRTKSVEVGIKWEEELQKLGYKGKLLTLLVEAIGDESNLGTFYQFVLDNDGKLNSKLSTVSRFIEFMKERESYQNAIDFYKEYIASNDIESKKNVLDKLFAESVDYVILNKVSEMIEKNVLSHEHLFDLVYHYRKSYNAKETITLIEYKLAKRV